MRYIYENARLPNDYQLINSIEQTASRLHKKLNSIKLKELGISDYNQKYWSIKLDNTIGILRLYSYLLALSLQENTIPLDKYVFVDYGGGFGCLSLLAKEMGIGRVIYNDIYNVSCDDIKIISSAINIDIDDIVCGAIDDLIDYLRRRSITINAISSFDVIEHIYDIEDYMRKLRFLSDKSFRVVFGSGANNENPFIKRKLEKQHSYFEYKDKVKELGHKGRDTLKSYFNARKNIISEYAPDIPEEAVENIAKTTRGLMKQDIEKCVKEYKTTKSISYKPDHPTNTCDPYTGNWAEHLMDQNCLKRILADEGFDSKILNGYYSYSDSVYKQKIKNTLNMAMKHVGKLALKISPYFIVYADYKGID